MKIKTISRNEEDFTRESKLDIQKVCECLSSNENDALCLLVLMLMWACAQIRMINSFIEIEILDYILSRMQESTLERLQRQNWSECLPGLLSVRSLLALSLASIQQVDIL